MKDFFGARLAGEIGIDLVWRSLLAQEKPLMLTWNIPKAELHQVTIEWPLHYRWQPIHTWVASLLDVFRKIVRVDRVALPQPYNLVVIFRILKRGTAYDIAIDCSDKHDFIKKEALAQSIVYFKMQYRTGGYGTDKIVPGGFTAAHPNLYRYLPHLRRLREKSNFTHDVYGRFGKEFSPEIRSMAASLLSKQINMRSLVNLSPIRYGAYLREAAHSKICIDLPGNGNFCFRLVDYLAMGSCVIGLKHQTSLVAPLVDRENIIYMKDDLSDLVDLCEYYLSHDKERSAIATRAKNYFDAYLHHEQLARYYLSVSLGRMP